MPTARGPWLWAFLVSFLLALVMATWAYLSEVPAVVMLIGLVGLAVSTTIVGAAVFRWARLGGHNPAKSLAAAVWAVVRHLFSFP